MAAFALEVVAGVDEFHPPAVGDVVVLHPPQGPLTLREWRDLALSLGQAGFVAVWVDSADVAQLGPFSAPAWVYEGWTNLDAAGDRRYQQGDRLFRCVRSAVAAGGRCSRHGAGGHGAAPLAAR